jgi:hypothetical protein
MEGDPLNEVNDASKAAQMRVIRIPAAEGPVFQSKEQVPVSSLIEINDEGAELWLKRRVLVIKWPDDARWWWSPKQRAQ